MTDITRDADGVGQRRLHPDQADHGKNGSAPASDALVACIELLFFAYRDFTAGPDAVLRDYGFGRAHHRVLHFVYRNPGIRVAALLHILKITKQSLARVLKQLLDEEFITQRTGAEDRRERLLFATPKGMRLAEKLMRLQARRVERAFAKAGPGADEAAQRFLLAMIADRERQKVEDLIRRGERTRKVAKGDAP